MFDLQIIISFTTPSLNLFFSQDNRGWIVFSLHNCVTICMRLCNKNILDICLPNRIYSMAFNCTSSTENLLLERVSHSRMYSILFDKNKVIYMQSMYLSPTWFFHLIWTSLLNFLSSGEKKQPPIEHNLNGHSLRCAFLSVINLFDPSSN